MSVNPQELFQWAWNRAKNRAFGLDPNSPAYKANFAKAFEIDPATQAVLNTGMATLNLTPSQRRAETAANESLRLGIKGQEQQLADTAQDSAVERTLRLNQGNTDVLGKRAQQQTDAYLARNEGLTNNQIKLIAATKAGERELQDGLVQSVIPQLLQHEKEMDNQNFSQNLPFMLGNLALGAAALFA